MPDPLRVTVRNATFQRWQTLLANRTKRLRAGEFMVHGVRPISAAIEQHWQVREVLADDRPRRSPWAEQVWRSTGAERYLVSSELMRELGEKAEDTPELLAVVGMPADDLSRLPVSHDMLVTVFDRPSSPGNVGTLARSIDAFRGTGLVVTGHAADPYDPKCVRASTGSLFAVPTIRVASHIDVQRWVERIRADGIPIVVIGTDEAGDTAISDFDMTQPLVMVIGNETTGMTEGWRDACDHLVRIPIGGTASSLNAATAGSVALYEAMRQRTLQNR